MIAVKKKKDINLRTISKTVLADVHTPVSLFLKLRDQFKHVMLLESNDFTSKEDCHSFLAIDVIEEIFVKEGVFYHKAMNGELSQKPLIAKDDLSNYLNDFVHSFKSDKQSVFNGLFGHTDFDCIQHFDTIKFDGSKENYEKPALRYSLFRFIIQFNHFKDELTLIENIPAGQQSCLHRIEAIIQKPVFNTFKFRLDGAPSSNMNDDKFKELVRIGKHHCKIGDVFQIVFSRRFTQKFSGDDFNVYRILRSVNPSPYLFYFDYGDYKLFGSSPESQIIVKDGEASVNPIAGTFKRKGDKIEDAKNALELSNDPKENSEHIMLVDLARNDLSIHCHKVEVENLKEIQFFSHVIHLVSKVKGQIKTGTTSSRIFGDTFPAGTLSGAPKYKAMQIIDQHEPTARGFYGGAIGFIDLQGNMNQAILIRSFLSSKNKLHYQAGAGIVINSEEEKELQEINNKLGALNQAIKKAETL